MVFHFFIVFTVNRYLFKSLKKGMNEMSGVPDQVRLARPQKSRLSVARIDKQRERSAKNYQNKEQERKIVKHERKYV